MVFIKYLPCAVNGFGAREMQHFSVFPRWRLYHMTYDVMIIIKIFCRRRRSYGENFVSITNPAFHFASAG